MMLLVVFPKFKTKCFKFIEKRESKFWQECKRKKIPTEKQWNRNKSNLKKVIPIIISAMIQILENIHGKSLITSIKSAIRSQKIALKTNGLTLLYFGKIKEKRNS